MNQLRTHLILLALAAGLAADYATAGDAMPPPPPSDRPGPPDGGPGDHHWRHFREFGMPLSLEEFDLNKDGRISHAEIDQVLRLRFDAADTNHDGQLDAAEFAALPRFEHHIPPPNGVAPPPPPPGGWRGPEGRRGPPDPAEMIKHLDWNLDDKVSFEEFAAPIRQMALHLDRNGDGVIAGDELRGPEFGPPGSGPLPPPFPPDR